MLSLNWSELFTFTVSPLELVVRGTLIYLFLFCLFRFVVHRDVGGLGVSDLLLLVIIADASQNALAGEYKSVVDGFVLIGTLVAWSLAFNFLSFRFRAIRRFVLPPPICLVKDGVKVDKNLRQEMISDDELFEMLREHEIEEIADVKRAYLEPDGQITVLKRSRKAERK